jgi:integrase/recombinase XerD
MVLLHDYLLKQHASSTAKAYEREILLYIKRVPGAEIGTYKTVINYLDYLRQSNYKPSSVNRILASLKSYYNYLLANEIRKDHPCKHLRLRDNKNKHIQLQDLFTTKELELLMDRKERYSDLALKNKVVISLYIYQGLTSGELVKLTVNDIDLDKGEITIKKSRTLNGRVLKLKQNQILLFYKYINENRPKLLRCKTSCLIIGKLGTVSSVEGVGYIIKTFQHLFPERKLTTITIRQSVITNKLKTGMDLRFVQHFSGHKYPSATEQYKQSKVEELKQGVHKYHPLK